MIGVTVKGGTNAGRRKPFQGQPLPWQCRCMVVLQDTGATRQTVTKTQPGHWASCAACGMRRPS